MSTYPLPAISLEGRVVIMTGGDRGLGRSMALALARCGASLVIASVDAEGCDRVAAEIDDIGGPGKGLAVPTDITNLGQCRQVVGTTLATFDRLDVLFNNARRLMRGPGLPPSGNSLPLWETDPEIYAQTVAVNVLDRCGSSATQGIFFLIGGFQEMHVHRHLVFLRCVPHEFEGPVRAPM